MINRDVNRRQFLKGVGKVSALGLTALSIPEFLAACANSSQSSSVGTNQSPKRGGTLLIGIASGGPTDTVDPPRSISVAEIVLTFNVFDRLVYQKRDWSLQPMLAEKWVSNSDGTKWTFNLRQGVQFHDGSPFGAQDVAWTLMRILDPKTGASLQGRLSSSLDPGGIQVVDDHTLVLNLKRPDTVLPIPLGDRSAGIVKRGVIPTPQSAIGTGPFTLSSFVAGQSWEIKRNPNYWQKGVPYLDVVREVGIPEQSSKLAAVQSGSVSLTDAIDFSAVSVLKSNGLQVIKQDSATYFDIAMDETQAPFTDLRVVQAVKLAIDRNKMNLDVFQSLGALTVDNPEPPDSPYYPPSLKVPSQDINQAKALLAAAGHPNGIDLELFTSDKNAGQVNVAVACADMLSAAGIRAKVNNWPIATYNSQIWLHKPMTVNNWLRRFPTDAMSLIYASTGVWNESKLKNTQLDNLVAQALGTADLAMQTKFIQQALLLVSENAGTAIPVYLPKVFGAAKNVNGVATSLTGTFDLRSAWLA